VPELTELSNEPDHVFELYGEQSRIPGTYAANCLLARRLSEAGVRFVQLFDRDWDHHRNLKKHMPRKTHEVDQPTAALIRDLKQRGLLEETLVICSGEFGRSVYSQGKLQDNYGRDHHGRCFTAWMAGAGVRAAQTVGETDEFCFNVTQNPVHVHDFNATILQVLGIDHTQLTFRHQGRDHRLTDVHGNVIREIIAERA
jgi:membrane-anchored protein YejM (alkaline phosphatase superfamily)